MRKATTLETNTERKRKWHNCTICRFTKYLPLFYYKVDTGIKISDLPDPDGVYASIIKVHNVGQSYIHMPNIRDKNGTLIKPTEYEQKLQPGTIVAVRVYLKL